MAVAPSRRSRRLAATIMSLGSGPIALRLYAAGAIAFIVSPVLFPAAIALGAWPWLMLTALPGRPPGQDAVRIAGRSEPGGLPASPEERSSAGHSASYKRTSYQRIHLNHKAGSVGSSHGDQLADHVADRF